MFYPVFSVLLLAYTLWYQNLAFLKAQRFPGGFDAVKYTKSGINYVMSRTGTQSLEQLKEHISFKNLAPEILQSAYNLNQVSYAYLTPNFVVTIPKVSTLATTALVDSLVSSPQTLYQLAKNVEFRLFMDSSNLHSSLISSVISNSLTSTKVLLSLGADVNTKDLGYGSLLSYMSLVRHDEEWTKLLIKYGANVNSRDGDENTALHFATFSKNEKVVEVLVANGADVNAQNIDKRTPLHEAVFQRDTKVTKILLEHGANVNAKDKHDSTPLDYARQIASPFVEVVSLLEARSAKDAKEDKSNKKTPTTKSIEDSPDIYDDKNFDLMMSLSEFNAKWVDECLKEGADVNARYKDELDETPLLHILKKLPASVTNTKGEKTTGIQMVELLLERGADVNAKDRYGSTALHEAIFQNRIEVIKLLLSKGADVSIKDSFGKSPLDYAMERLLPHKELIHLLEEKQLELNTKTHAEKVVATKSDTEHRSI